MEKISVWKRNERETSSFHSIMRFVTCFLRPIYVAIGTSPLCNIVTSVRRDFQGAVLVGHYLVILRCVVLSY
jgi:hypothetical protein